MAGALTVDGLRAAVARGLKKMEACQSELNAQDGQLGDGDIGVTLVNGFRSMQQKADDLPDDVGMALMQFAQALTRSGGSSYATLLATGLMAAARDTRGKTSVPWGDIPVLLESAVTKMAERGKSRLGDKTVLDAVDAAREGSAGAADPSGMLAAALAHVDARLEALRDQPCRQGRARIFADKSAGLDDPGMLAFKRIVEALQ